MPFPRIASILTLAALAALPLSASADASTVTMRTIATAGLQPHVISALPDGSAWMGGTVSLIDGSATAAGGIASPQEGVTMWTAGGDDQWDDVIASVPGLAHDGWLAGVGGDLQHSNGLEMNGNVLPAATGGVTNLTVGADKRLWYVEPLGSSIDALTVGGKRTIRKLPRVPWTKKRDGAASFPIVAGPDKRIWFAGATAIGAITTRGHVTWYRRAAHATSPRAIVSGPGKSVWIVGSGGDVTRVRTSGTATRLKGLPGTGLPLIAAGPKGRVWLGRQKSDVLGELTVGGKLTTRKFKTLKLMQLAGSGSRLWGLNKSLELLRFSVGSVGPVVPRAGECDMPADAKILTASTALSIGTRTNGIPGDTTTTWWVCRRDVRRLQVLDQIRDTGGAVKEGYSAFATAGSTLAYALGTDDTAKHSASAQIQVRNLAIGTLDGGQTGQLYYGNGRLGGVDKVAVNSGADVAWIQHTDHAEVRVYSDGVQRTLATGPTGTLANVAINALTVTWTQNGVAQSAPIAGV
jgi:hypothetical protein